MRPVKHEWVLAPLWDERANTTEAGFFGVVLFVGWALTAFAYVLAGLHSVVIRALIVACTCTAFYLLCFVKKEKRGE